MSKCPAVGMKGGVHRAPYTVRLNDTSGRDGQARLKTNKVRGLDFFLQEVRGFEQGSRMEDGLGRAVTNS